MTRGRPGVLKWMPFAFALVQGQAGLEEPMWKERRSVLPRR
jgi:hypothetical protein